MSLDPLAANPPLDSGTMTVAQDGEEVIVVIRNRMGWIVPTAVLVFPAVVWGVMFALRPEPPAGADLSPAAWRAVVLALTPVVSIVLCVVYWHAEGGRRDVITLGQDQWRVQHFPRGNGGLTLIDPTHVQGLRRLKRRARGHHVTASVLRVGNQWVYLTDCGTVADREWLRGRMARLLPDTKRHVSPLPVVTARRPPGYRVTSDSHGVRLIPVVWRHCWRRGGEILIFIFGAAMVLSLSGADPAAFHTADAAEWGVYAMGFSFAFWAVARLLCWDDWLLEPGKFVRRHHWLWLSWEHSFGLECSLAISLQAFDAEAGGRSLELLGPKGRSEIIVQDLRSLDDALAVGRWLSEQTGFPLEPPWEPV